MADFAGGKIQIFVGPGDLGGPDNLEAAIIEFIGDAKSTLDIAVQELDNEAIAQAILDAAYRGVNIRMFLEQDYLKASKHPNVRATATFTLDERKRSAQWSEHRRPITRKTNRDILAALLRCGVDVKGDLNPEIFHQKFIVRDYRGRKSLGRPALLTGSTNFTHTGTHKNLNHVIVFHDYIICRQYADEFEELRSGTFGALRARRDAAPKIRNIKGVPVRILFAPDHAPELEIVKQMLKCDKNLRFAVFTFSGSSGIDDAMVMLRRARVKISGVLDPGQGRQSWAATKWLHEEGIRVFFPDGTKIPGLGKLHHKLMVIDETIVIAGSMNYTQPANLYNDENIFVLGSPHVDLPKSKGGPVDVDECAAICRYFNKEIERIRLKSTRFEQ